LIGSQETSCARFSPRSSAPASGFVFPNPGAKSDCRLSLSLRQSCCQKSRDYLSRQELEGAAGGVLFVALASQQEDSYLSFGNTPDFRNTQSRINRELVKGCAGPVDLDHKIRRRIVVEVQVGFADDQSGILNIEAVIRLGPFGLHLCPERC